MRGILYVGTFSPSFKRGDGRVKYKYLPPPCVKIFCDNLPEFTLNFMLLESAQESAGAAIMWYTNGTVTDEAPEYCYNSAVISVNDTLVCSRIDETWQTPFKIADGSIIPDVAALSGLVKESSTSGVANNTNNDHETATQFKSNDSNNDAAIGAGVGVPLGVIALFAIGWVLWERHMRKKTPGAASPVSIDKSSYVRELNGSKAVELYDGSTVASYH
ncbi:uncharacterized protein N7498_006103 [Penicillium cinerascens]|uniref:Uncharacterized protein n=1 Tax=Penicillium cinerascens TaxID=70096 RepID=A0A9W9SX75_9EURO|nr:uncharacterized protein N7498_006103 [Penicillium cinerascens]KAJ5201440.1 hypothetical protein N7498_006103 [Penicillium cinerascens]